MFISSSITGTKGLHVCAFKQKSFDMNKSLVLMETYKLPYLQVFNHEGTLYNVCFTPVSVERYKKILRAFKSSTLLELEKYGHVLFPLVSLANCVNLTNGSTMKKASRPHLTAFNRLQNTIPAGPILQLVGKDPPHVFRKVNHG